MASGSKIKVALNPLRRILIKILRVTELTVSAGHIVAMVTCPPLSGHIYIFFIYVPHDLHYIALHYVTLYYITLHYMTFYNLNNITLHTLRYITQDILCYLCYTIPANYDTC